MFYIAIAILEFLYGMQNGSGYMLYYFPSLNRIYALVFINLTINLGCQMSLVDGVKSLTIFLSLQRAVACLIPTKYYLISGRKVCLMITLGIIVATNLISGPYFFQWNTVYNNVTNTYVSQKTELKNSADFKTYDIFYSRYYVGGQGIAVLASSFLAVAGMWKAIFLR